jgi:hypothetical protein
MASLLPAQTQNFSLYGSGVSIGDTTMVLSSFQSIDGVNLAIGDFGTIGYMTIEPGSRDREEQISFSGVTQNANGTATLTGIKTVLFLSPYTETSGFAKSHPGGVVAVVTNTSGFYNQFPTKGDNEAITGYWTVPDPVSATDIANKQYVLSVVTGGTVSFTQVIVTATAGETVAAGQLLYFDTTENEWMKTDADTEATVVDSMLGIAQGSGTNGNTITGGVLIHGLDANQTGMTQGDPMYASNTAGAISSSPGTVSRTIGIARTATSLYFDPFYNPGTSTALKAGIQNSTYVYAADSVGTDAYAITVSPTPSAYAAGQLYQFKAGTANTAGATLAVNGGAPKTIVKNVSEALNTGDILASQIVTVIYDGTNFQLLSKTPTITPTTNLYITSQTWSKPAGIKYARVRVVGSGGGGGAGNSGAAGGGGGGGGYSEKIIAAASLGSTETVTVGAAGTGGVNGGAAAGTGGTVSFGSHLQATGGSGGAVGSNAIAVAGGIGGVGSLGTINVVGTGGTAGMESPNGVYMGGAGGASSLGGGGYGTGGDGVGGVGGVYGGGGGGGTNANSGAVGGIGVVIVEEFY